MAMKTCLLSLALCLVAAQAAAQQIAMREYAPLEQVCGEAYESDELLPMGDVGTEFGYVLYEAVVTLPEGGAELELENVRDYAAVYLDAAFQATLTDGSKRLALHGPAGEHTLRLYVENIGRITYGPEILDNSKGLFGRASLGGDEIAAWRIVPLEVRECDPAALTFEPLDAQCMPGFRRGSFDGASSDDRYLDVTGWGMGEVWINGRYLGAFWDEEKQQSILIPGGTLRERDNVIVVFDIKNHDPRATMRLSPQPVFR